MHLAKNRMGNAVSTNRKPRPASAKTMRNQLLDIILICRENLPGVDLVCGNGFAFIHVKSISKEAGSAGIEAKESKACSEGRQG
jgi:hypothetical protein